MARFLSAKPATPGPGSRLLALVLCGCASLSGSGYASPDRGAEKGQVPAEELVRAFHTGPMNAALVLKTRAGAHGRLHLFRDGGRAATALVVDGGMSRLTLAGPELVVSLSGRPTGPLAKTEVTLGAAWMQRAWSEVAVAAKQAGDAAGRLMEPGVTWQSSLDVRLVWMAQGWACIPRGVVVEVWSRPPWYLEEPAASAMLLQESGPDLVELPTVLIGSGRIERATGIPRELRLRDIGPGGVAPWLVTVTKGKAEHLPAHWNALIDQHCQVVAESDLRAAVRAAWRDLLRQFLVTASRSLEDAAALQGNDLAKRVLEALLLGKWVEKLHDVEARALSAQRKVKLDAARALLWRGELGSERILEIEAEVKKSAVAELERVLRADIATAGAKAENALEDVQRVRQALAAALSSFAGAVGPVVGRYVDARWAAAR